MLSVEKSELAGLLCSLLSSIKNLLKKLNLFCGQQTPIVRISSCVSNVTISVTDNIFQLIVDFWHMLLVNDDDDVGFSLFFLYNAMFCI